MASQQASTGREHLVIGAGELGGNVVAALTRRDDAPPVTVLLRSSDTPRHARLRDEFAARGVGIVEADIATVSAAELSTVLRRFHTVVSCIGFAAGWEPNEDHRGRIGGAGFAILAVAIRRRL